MIKLIMSNPLIFLLIGPTGLWILIPVAIVIKKIIEISIKMVINIVDPVPMKADEETPKIFINYYFR
jgi:hypothetical protein